MKQIPQKGFKSLLTDLGKMMTEAGNVSLGFFLFVFFVTIVTENQCEFTHCAGS